jgi:2-C-methyl-D-erythritol 4-phosphate cytidylyltransferase / 2-C-methyl-D-erythritol 2,4-cyclodiphosphate synthase
VALVLAAGSGVRSGLDTPKAFAAVGHRSILARAVDAAAGCPLVTGVVVTVPAGFESRAEELLRDAKPPLSIVAGGSDRQASVRRALGEVPQDVTVVICHDAARPFASPALFAAVLGALSGVEGVIPVVPIPDTVKRVDGGRVRSTEDRNDLVLAQTPQAFAASALRDAHQRAAAEGRTFTDDAAILEWVGYRVSTVPGEPSNYKITTPDDLARAEREVTAHRR